MSTQWLLVGDAASARLFARGADESLHLITTLEHPQSRAHEGDLRTGGKGEVHDSAGSGMHQPDPQTRTSEKHADIFAKQVVERLESGRNRDAFDALVLVAEPAFLGRLRDHMDAPLRDRVSHDIDKNWTRHSAERIERLLAEQR